MELLVCVLLIMRILNLYIFYLPLMAMCVRGAINGHFGGNGLFQLRKTRMQTKDRFYMHGCAAIVNIL